MRPLGAFRAGRLVLRRPMLILLLLQLAACATPPPQNTADICSMFNERHNWYTASKQSERRWGVPIPVSMAIMQQESSFMSHAKPPRSQLFGFIPWTRPSDAYGYAQALDSTWGEYKESAGNWGARRSDFKDAVDFVGWYANTSSRQAGIRKNDAYNLYLAYHEGNGGFLKKTYSGKDWLLKAARNVRENSARYDTQLQTCRAHLDRSWFMRLFF